MSKSEPTINLETIFGVEDLYFMKKILEEYKKEKIENTPIFKDSFNMEDYLINKINNILNNIENNER